MPIIASGEKRIDHRLDCIEVELRILHRPHDAFANQLRIAGIIAARTEFRLPDADDADTITTHARASRPSTTAA
jgi:hypothetical protein